MARTPKTPKSFRLPKSTLDQIALLAAEMGGAANVIQVAVDRLYTSMFGDGTDKPRFIKDQPVK